MYCGSTTQITHEHVFPKNLFLPPRPKLITVPACERCNKSYDQDDEYFRAFVVTRAFQDPTGRKMWDEKIVASTLKRSPRLKKALVDSLRRVEFKSPAGIYLGDGHEIGFKRARVDRIVEKIVRGLYRHHLGRRLRSKSAFDIHFNPKFKSLRDAGFLEIFEAAPLFRIGDGKVVQYRFEYVRESPERSIWLLLFYGTTPVAVLVNAEAPETSPEEI